MNHANDNKSAEVESLLFEAKQILEEFYRDHREATIGGMCEIQQSTSAMFQEFIFSTA